MRTGANTLCVFADMPPERTIKADDTVYLDLGLVFESSGAEAWEADISLTYALGSDAARHTLVAALQLVFEATRTHANANPDITGA